MPHGMAKKQKSYPWNMYTTEHCSFWICLYFLACNVGFKWTLSAPTSLKQTKYLWEKKTFKKIIYPVSQNQGHRDWWLPMGGGFEKAGVGIWVMYCAWSLSCIRLFVIPWTVAHLVLLSIGVLRQEYWSGLPWSPPGDLPNPGIKPRTLTLQADSLLSEPPGEPKNTGVGSPSLLQGVFPAQELNQGLLHCRQILYQLSY